VKSLISKLAMSSLSTAKSKEKVMTLPVEMSETPPDSSATETLSVNQRLKNIEEKLEENNLLEFLCKVEDEVHEVERELDNMQETMTDVDRRVGKLTRRFFKLKNEMERKVDKPEEEPK
jgi:predicted  nucleic acid-binding Zn-ribbon protein